MSLELNADTEDSAHTDTENDEELEELEELEEALTSEDWYHWPDRSALDRVYELSAVDDCDIYNSSDEASALAVETPSSGSGDIDASLPVNPVDDGMYRTSCPTRIARNYARSERVTQWEKKASLTRIVARL